MTYREIFSEIYGRHKRWIRLYAAFAVILSVAAFCSGHAVLACAVAASAVAAEFSGDAGKLFIPIMESHLTGVDAPLMLAGMSVLSILADSVPQSVLDSLHLSALSGYSFGLLDIWGIRIFVIAWCVVSRLALSGNLTRIAGMSLKELGKYFEIAANVIVMGSQLYANLSDNTVQAAERIQSAGAPHAAANAAGSSIAASLGASLGAFFGTNLLYAVLLFCLLILLPIVYYIIRCLFFFLDILLIPICTLVPFASFLTETCKVFYIVIMIALALAAPGIFMALSAGVLIAAVLLFKRAYITIRYFKNIYVKTFWDRLVGRGGQVPLYTANAPEKVKKLACGASVLLPVYLINELPGYPFMKKYDRWWFVAAPGSAYICKPRFLKENCYVIPLQSIPGKHMYMKQSARFFEVFDMQCEERDMALPFRKIPKQMHFVFSKIYLPYFAYMKQITGFLDYGAYEEGLKNWKKAEKRMRKNKSSNAFSPYR